MTTRLKENRLLAWKAQQISNAQVYSNSPFFAEALEKYFAFPNNMLRNELLKRCEIIRKYKAYTNVIIAGTDGNIEISLDPRIKGLDGAALKQMSEVLRTNQTVMGDICMCPVTHDLYIDIMSPITNKENKVAAILILCIDPVKELIPRFQNDPVLEKDVETILVSKIQDQIVLLGSHDNGSVILLPAKEPSLLFKALSDNKTRFTGPGFDNRKVIAHLQPVTGTTWHLVTQTGYRDVLSTFYRYAKIDIVITVLIILLLLLAIVFLFQFRQKTMYRNLLQTELAFREERERFRTTLYSIGDGVITTDEHGLIMHMNNVASKLTGWEESEAIGKPLREVFHIINEGTLTESENPLERVLHEGVIVGLANHTLLVSRNGTKYPVADSGAPIRNNEGEIIGAVLVFRDQTIERKAEKELRQSEQRFRSTFEMASIGKSLTSINGELVDINHAFADMLGYTKEELSAMNFADVTFPDDLPESRECFRCLLAGEKDWYRVEKRYIRKDGSLIWADVNTMLLKDSRGNPLYFITHIVDITERKQMEAERFRLLDIIEKSINEIYVFDSATLNFEYVNTCALKNLGFGFDEMKKLTPPDITPEFTADTFRQLLTPLISGEKDVLVFETKHRRKNGDFYPIDVHLQLFERGNKSVLLAIINDITWRKNAEEDTRQNHERWKSLFDNSPNAIAIYKAVDGGNDFIFTDFNLTAQKTDNLKHDDVVGKRISELFPAAEGLGFLDVFRKVWRTGRTEYMNTTNYKDIRIEGWRENIIFRLNTGEIVAIYNDISARMNAEIALRESEEKFRSIFENHSAIMLLIDPDTGNIVDANEAAANYYGWSRNELKQMKIQQINTLPSEHVLDRMKEIKMQKQAHFEFRHQLKDESIRDVEVFSSKIEIGGKVYLHSINHDVTERKRAENALRESEFFFRESQRAAFVGSYKYDLITGFWDSSEVLDHIFGIDREYIRSVQGWEDLIHPDDQEMMDQYLKKEVMGRRNPFNKEYRIVRKSDGETRWVNGLGQLNFDAEGNILSLIGTIQDITERRRAEEALVKAKEKAEESDRLKTAFLQNISHEIRTPMNAIVGFSGFLNDPGLLPEKRKHFTEMIVQSSNQLLSIITDIISIATIEAGQGKIYEMEITLNSTLKLLYAQFIGRAQKKGVILRFETSLPDNEDRIKSDETKLGSILSNLIGNALKFTKKGCVNFGYYVKDTHLEFYVEDTGIGIPSEMHDEIFKRFRQVETTASRQYGGTGLGLSISKSYVELLGGKMWLTSEPGKGSAFYFTIPYKKVIPNGLSDKPSKEVKLELHKPQTILIAEDEDSNFMLLKELLSVAELDIIRAVNGLEAVEICKSNPHIDVVLMDIKMPVMDGLEATRRIKAMNPGLPVIAQTAYSLPEEKETALKAGCRAFLSKPIKANELIKVLNQMMVKG
jgi:PAS domain S-box-containing protein